MKIKKALRVVAFLLILCLALGYLFHCYNYPHKHDTRSLAAFADLDKNTVDGLVLGTSVIKYGFIPTVAYEQNGITVGQLGTSLQPFGATLPLIKYAQKRQNIKYVVVDVHGLRTAAVKNSIVPAKIQNVYLNIPNYFEGQQVLQGLLEYAERAYEYYGKPEDEKLVVDRSDIAWYVPFVNFHSRWKDGLTKSDFRLKPTVRYIGAYDVKDRVFSSKDCSMYYDCWDYEPTEADVDDFQKNELKILTDYLEEQNIKVLFINMPSFRPVDEQRENASLIEYCKSLGYDTIDFCTEEMIKETGIDPAADFLNRGHLNSAGSVKFTKYIASYLVSHGFTSDDHRGDGAHDYWDEQAKAYDAFYKKGWAEKGRTEEIKY